MQHPQRIVVAVALAAVACGTKGGSSQRTDGGVDQAQATGGSTGLGGAGQGGAPAGGSPGSGGTGTGGRATGGAAGSGGVGAGGIGAGGTGGIGVGGGGGIGTGGGGGTVLDAPPADSRRDLASPVEAGDADPGCGTGRPAGSSWPLGDGCNTCYCEAGGSTLCTTRQCPPPVEGGPDAPPAAVDAALTACGGVTCGGTQICIRPSCAGGTAPPCLPLGDASACPASYTQSSFCQYQTGGAGPGCLPPRCTDPPPFCLDLPAACSGKPACGCLPGNVCGTGGGSCMMVAGSTVQCGSA
jgi:hypothetical protein